MGVRIQIAGVYGEAGYLDEDIPEGEAKRADVASKIEKLGNAENESWGVEFGYRYDESSVIAYDGKPPIDPLVYTPRTNPGSRLPHVFLDDGASLYDRLGLFFTLVVVDEADTAALEAAAFDLGIPVDVVCLGRPDLRALYERNFLLVRPDQHIAWRGDELPADPADMLKLVTGWN